MSVSNHKSWYSQFQYAGMSYYGFAREGPGPYPKAELRITNKGGTNENLEEHKLLQTHQKEEIRKMKDKKHLKHPSITQNLFLCANRKNLPAKVIHKGN